MDHLELCMMRWNMALVGHATLWAAMVADIRASLVVVANGMRLLCAASFGRVLAPVGAET